MEGELMLSILSSLAESESVSISENNKWSAQKRFQNGTFKVAYPPYGYDNVDGQMVVNEEQAEVVCWMFEQALAGKGTHKIASELNDGVFRPGKAGAGQLRQFGDFWRMRSSPGTSCSRRPTRTANSTATIITARGTGISWRTITPPL